MKYMVTSLSVYGGQMTWEFDNKNDALKKVRELKDNDMKSSFIVKITEYETV